METPDQKLEEISKDLTVIQEESDTYTIQSPADVISASEFLSKVKARSKRIEEIRKFFVDPLNKQVKDINNLFKPKIEALEAIEVKVKRLVSDYSMKQEMARREDERRLQEAHAKEMAKLEKKADKKGEDFVPTIAPIIAQTPQTLKSDSVKTTTVIEWKFEVIDSSLVPREFCEVSETLIRKSVKDGKREIAGVRIYEDAQIRIGTI